MASTNLFESVFVGLASFAPLTGAGGIGSHLYFEVIGSPLNGFGGKTRAGFALRLGSFAG